MSVLGRLILKHLALYLGSVWTVLTLCVFVLGVVELSMNRLIAAVDGKATPVFVDSLSERIDRLPEYAAETMAYAGLVGLLMGFWTLWRRKEFLQFQLLGARNVLCRNAVLVSLLFGTLHMTLVEKWDQEEDNNPDAVVRSDLKIIRDTAQGGKIMLFADRYFLHSGNFEGARLLLFDKNFRMQSILLAEGGRIEPKAWVLRNGTRVKEPGEQTTFRQERFALETDLLALSHVLQPDPYALSLWQLPQALHAVRANAHSTKPFVRRALFLLSLPLFYASFALLAYALCLTLPHRTTGMRMALFIVLLPCTIEFLRHIAWSRVFAETLHPLLPALGLPIAFVCTTAFLMRNERLFS